MDTVDRMPLGLALMFSSLIVGMLAGAVVGRFTRFEWGAATALLALALGGLGGAAWVASYYHLESTVVDLPRSGCLSLAGYSGKRSWSAARYVLITPSGAEVTLQGGPDPVACEDRHDDAELHRLRVLKRALVAAGGEPVGVVAETDPRVAIAGPVVLATFGSFGLLAGLFFLASGRQATRLARQGPEPEPAVSPRRRQVGGWLVMAGNFSLLGAVLGALFGELEGEGATVLVFGTVPLACLLYALAMAVRGRLRADQGLILLIVGAGCGAAAWSVAVLT